MTVDWALLACTASEESDLIDFKSECVKNKPGFWCELVKDLVSFANSSGGVIVFGLDSFGNPTGGECSDLVRLDTADIQNQINKYTGCQIRSLEKFQVERSDGIYWAISVGEESTIIPFIDVGTYEVEPRKQKTAFSRGTVYFRHGSKSEPGVRDDYRSWLDRELNKTRSDWLANIRKVVEAPLGQSVIVVTADNTDTASQTLSARITNDEKAIPIRLHDPRQTWPYRGKQVIELLREKTGKIDINSHDIVALKAAMKITEKSHPHFILKTHDAASPQYSESFVEWVSEQYRKDSNFFLKVRADWKQLTYKT